MSSPILHPTLEGVLAIHAAVLATHGGSPTLRSRELLESALAAPQAVLSGTPLISDPIEIAAAYLFYLCRNDAFVDGSTRVALATCLAFLSEAGLLRSEELDGDAWESLTLEAAGGMLRRDEVTQKLRDLVA
jgi:death-on-curing protein